MSYGFEKAKKSIETAGPEKKLDLTGLDLPPPAVTPEQEASAVARGDTLGFGSREPALAPTRTTFGALASTPTPLAPIRRRKALPHRSILVKGPEEVMDRFVRYVEDTNAGAYWEAIDGLLKAKGR